MTGQSTGAALQQGRGRGGGQNRAGSGRGRSPDASKQPHLARRPANEIGRAVARQHGDDLACPAHALAGEQGSGGGRGSDENSD